MSAPIDIPENKLQQDELQPSWPAFALFPRFSSFCALDQSSHRNKQCYSIDCDFHL